MLFKNITVIDEYYQEQRNQFLLTEGTSILSIADHPPTDYTGEVYDGTGKVAMPGFFNLHCHLPMTLLRGYGEGLPLHRWLHERMFPFEDLMTADDMYWGALLGIAELIRGGAVSVTDMYMEVEAIARAVEQSGFKANLARAASSPSPGTRFADLKAYEGARFLAQLNRAPSNGRIIGEAAIHAEYTADEVLVRDIADFARENSMRMQLHLSETKGEHEGCKERHEGLTPAAWFCSLGAFDVPATAAHCVWVEQADIELLAQKGVTAVHCPSSNLKLGSGVAPVGKLLQSAVPVAIGTDGAASNNNLNMLEEVNLASLLQKGASFDPLMMGTVQTITLGCRNGAMAQGRPDCGALKAGNRADIVVYDMDKPHMQPVYDTLANVLYAGSAGDIALTMIDGQVVYQNGELLTIDVEQAIWQAKRIAKEKLAQLGQ